MIDPKDTRMDGLDEAGLEAAAEALAEFYRGPYPETEPFHAISRKAISAYLRRSTIGGEPVGYLFEMRYAPNHWSGPMYSDKLLLPTEDTRNVRPLYAHPAPSTGEGVKVVALPDGMSIERLRWNAAQFDSLDSTKMAKKLLEFAALHPSIGDSEAGTETSLRNVQTTTSGLSPFAGWQNYQHQRAACAAVFRDGWSMEDENTLIDLVTRTWPRPSPAKTSTGE